MAKTGKFVGIGGFLKKMLSVSVEPITFSVGVWGVWGGDVFIIYIK